MAFPNVSVAESSDIIIPSEKKFYEKIEKRLIKVLMKKTRKLRKSTHISRMSERKIFKKSLQSLNRLNRTLYQVSEVSRSSKNPLINTNINNWKNELREIHDEGNIQSEVINFFSDEEIKIKAKEVIETLQELDVYNRLLSDDIKRKSFFNKDLILVSFGSGIAALALSAAVSTIAGGLVYTVLPINLIINLNVFFL